MRRKSKQVPVVCSYFSWRLFERNGVWYADGRGGKHDVGKHSLGTKDWEEALTNLRRLDQRKALELGLAKSESKIESDEIPIVDGWKLFMDHCARPQVMGGVSDNTQKRYRAVRDKHIEFCKSRT